MNNQNFWCILNKWKSKMATKMAAKMVKIVKIIRNSV